VIRTTNFDAIITASPINKDAAVSRDGRGFSYEPDKKIACRHWENQPLLREPTGEDRDLIGFRWGRLIALGYLAEDPGKLWVVRCDCGRYETRRNKSLKRASPVDCCQQCGHVAHLKRQSFRDRHGKWPPVEYGR